MFYDTADLLNSEGNSNEVQLNSIYNTLDQNLDTGEKAANYLHHTREFRAGEDPGHYLL